MAEISRETSSENSYIWYAIRTFNCKELKVGDYLSEHGKEYFIPMTYALKKIRDGRTKRILLPVVHNLIFLKKDCSEKSLLKLLSDCPVPITVFRKENSTDCYEIPDREMFEFRILCDPDFDGSVFMTKEEADLRPGREVRIVYGPFSGITGKIHRVNKEYYFIKTLASIGVMVRIPRLYCKPV